MTYPPLSLTHNLKSKIKLKILVYFLVNLNLNKSPVYKTVKIQCIIAKYIKTVV